MFTLIVGFTALAVLYGLIWHDQSPKEEEAQKATRASSDQNSTTPSLPHSMPS